MALTVGGDELRAVGALEAEEGGSRAEMATG
jgi:hypothetical protein